MSVHARARWAGRKVLITGGSSGIGRQLAADLLRLGSRVCIVANGGAKLAEAEAELRAISPLVWSFLCDVSALADVRAMGAEYRRREGVPDVVVCNAGYAVYETFEQMSLEEVERLIAVNLTGAALVVRECLPAMIEARAGHVVLVSSIAGRLPLTPNSVYGAAKAGMGTLAELLQIETARFNIGVHLVCPGRVETDFFAHESFRRRTRRPETEYTIPIRTVTSSIIGAVDRNRFLTYVPRYYVLLAWVLAAVPSLAKPLWYRLLRSRIESYYSNLGRA